MPRMTMMVPLLWILGVGTGLPTAVLAQDPQAPPLATFGKAWGDQGTEPGEFHFPIGVAINRADEVFVTDHYNNRVQRFDPEGKLLARFDVLPNPGGIAIDKAGDLYLTHFPSSRLQKDGTPDRVSVYSPEGKFLREWGKSGTGDGEFSWPGGLAISPEGRVYVADQTNRRVQVFDTQGKFLFKWGEYGLEPGQFGGNISPKSRVGGPQFIALDRQGNVYTTEARVGRVQKFTAEGKFLLAWGDNENKPGSFGGDLPSINVKLFGPVAICTDAADNLWVTAVSGRVQRYSNTGQYQGGFGEKQGTDPGQFLAPHGIAVNSNGHIFVVDSYNHRIQKFETVK